MAGNSRLSGVVRLVQFIWLSVKLHYAAFKEALRKDGLASLTHPQRIRDAAVAKLFITSADGFIAFENSTCVPSLMRAAYGQILELGPASGNQIQRYDAARVAFIYGVDPNPHFAAALAAKVQALQLQDRYRFLACGVEDSALLAREGVRRASMDTVLSIQVLCAVRDVPRVMRHVWELLKPGGSFVFWEHERSKDAVTAAGQACLNPAWSAFVGCCINRDIKAHILAAGEWENPGDIEVADDPYSYLPRIWGVLKKKA